MQIIEEGEQLRIQLKDIKEQEILFDFTIENDLMVLTDLAQHITNTFFSYIKDRIIQLIDSSPQRSTFEVPAGCQMCKICHRIDDVTQFGTCSECGGVFCNDCGHIYPNLDHKFLCMICADLIQIRKKILK